MIIEGEPKLGLQNHQQEAYEAVKKAYEEGNKASVVIPTGCGKSFIALQLMADNKDKRILFMAPTNPIKDQMYNYIAKYIVGEEPTKERTARMIAEDYFPNLKIKLYPILLRVNDELMEKLNADIIIMDELHRTGADKWGPRVDTLLEKNPNAKILGLTATPDRMDNKNIIDELFEGKVDYELTLVEALRERIVKSPTYVKCDYALGEHLEGIKKAIAECTDEQTKQELQNKYNKMRKIVEQADEIPELFTKNIKKKDGKYIVFCKDKKHMDELMIKAKEWFRGIDTEPEIYSVFAGKEGGYSKKENAETINKFENSKSEHLKLLFSVKMLNEGLHVEDISGVIMTSPTNSRITYLQQLGRALSSDISREKPIVFDLVNNYLQYNLDAEINRRTDKDRNIDKTNHDTKSDYTNTDIEDIDIFRIQGETQEFLELLIEAQGIIDRSSYLTNARKIKDWIEKSGGTKPPYERSKDPEEKRLGGALSRIRQRFIKPYMDLKTDEEKETFQERHPEIDEVIKIVEEIDRKNIPTNLANAMAVEAWIEKSGDTKPPSPTSKNPEEKQLGIALSTMRQRVINPYMSLQTDEEKEDFRKRHPEIDEVMKIVEEIDRKNIPTNLANAMAVEAWIEKSGDTKPPSQASKNPKEKKLAQRLGYIRKQLINPYMDLKTDEEKEKFRKIHPEIDEVMEIIERIDSNNIPTNLANAMAVEAWIEKSGDTKPPSQTSKNPEEKRLGNALSNIRRGLIKPYMSLKTDEEKETFREKHPEIDEVMAIISKLDLQCGTKEQKELAILVQQDLEKRKILQEAKDLEQQYEQQLSIKEEDKDKSAKGVDTNE